MSQDGFWVTPPPLLVSPTKERLFYGFSSGDPLLLGVPIGSLFPKTKWVPFGSPSQSLGVPIKFRDCAFAGQGPHFHPKKLLAPVIKGKVHLGNVYIAELWSASTQLNSCGLLISSHFMYAFRLFAT